MVLDIFKDVKDSALDNNAALLMGFEWRVRTEFPEGIWAGETMSFHFHQWKPTSDTPQTSLLEAKVLDKGKECWARYVEVLVELVYGNDITLFDRNIDILNFREGQSAKDFIFKVATASARNRTLACILAFMSAS